MALSEQQDVATYWNGRPVVAERLYVRTEAGHIRRAVLVWLPDEQILLDDEDGSGWYKVTVGHGHARWPHTTLSDLSVVIARNPTW